MFRTALSPKNPIGLGREVARNIQNQLRWVRRERIRLAIRVLHDGHVRSDLAVDRVQR